MAVDAQLQPLLDMINAAPITEWTVERAGEFREVFDGMVTMLGAGPADVATEDRTAPGPAGEIPIRIYRPVGVEQPGVLVFFHGGGFVIGNIATHDASCRYLVSDGGFAVVSVDYRLAPEHPFPAGPDDCLAALRWIADHGDELGVDTSRLAVGGDSAGGNLAAVTALRARDEGGPALTFQLLVYPVVDLTPTLDHPVYPSMTENAVGYFLSMNDMLFFGECYVAQEADRRVSMASPILSESLADLPPALVMTCEFDPLRDQGESYAKALSNAGVQATLSRYDGAIHGVMNMAGITDIGRRFLTEAALAVKAAIG